MVARGRRLQTSFILDRLGTHDCPSRMALVQSTANAKLSVSDQKPKGRSLDGERKQKMLGQCLPLVKANHRHSSTAVGRAIAYSQTARGFTVLPLILGSSCVCVGGGNRLLSSLDITPK